MEAVSNFLSAVPGPVATKKGAERKAWVAQMLRAALATSKYGRFISWAITDETIGVIIQFFFDRMKAALQKQ